MNDDLFSSNIDDDLFDDATPSGVQQQVNPNNNPGQMVGQNAVTAANPNAVQTGGRSDDNELLNRLNDNAAATFKDDDNNGDEDVLSSYLRSMGIDPNNIQVDDENGNPSYSSFSSLSRTEQLDLLQSLSGGSNESNNDYDLDDDEIDLINSIRRSKMSIEDFVTTIQNRAVQNYVNSGGGQQYYDIDQLTDDDLFISDYKNRVPDATEDEVVAALNAAKTNPQSYERMMDGLRDTYKKQEEAIYQQRLQESEDRTKRQQQEYEGLIVDTLNGMSNMKLGDLDAQLSDEDKEDIASAILDSDATGTRYLVGLINDPETLSKMVWYALKGDEAINQMQRYYKNEINNRQQAAYQKGFEDAKNGKGMSYVVKKPVSKPSRGQFKDIPTLDDLDAGLD